MKRQEFSRMSKYHGKSHKLRNLLISVIIFICLIIILFKIASLSSNHSNPSKVTEPESSSTLTEETTKKQSSSVSEASSSTNSMSVSFSSGSNSTMIFDDLQSAIDYGRQCVNNHTCNNFKVTNDNGKYVVELY